MFHYDYKPLINDHIRICLHTYVLINENNVFDHSNSIQFYLLIDVNLLYN